MRNIHPNSLDALASIDTDTIRDRVRNSVIRARRPVSARDILQDLTGGRDGDIYLVRRRLSELIHDENSGVVERGFKIDDVTAKKNMTVTFRVLNGVQTEIFH
jgi:hypothetical protein